LIKVYFKNVQQGDSIIIEWDKDDKKSYGIIDCNKVKDRNPIVEHIANNGIKEIEFIILSHLHLDHFSGMAELFTYCMNNSIRVNYFYHTIGSFYNEVYDNIFTDQKLKVGLENFFLTLDQFDYHILDSIQIDSTRPKIELSQSYSLKFLAPQGKLYKEISRKLSHKKIFETESKIDINELSTIISIENNTQCFLLTSDAVKRNFKKLRRTIKKELILVQVPHHGSKANLDKPFWMKLIKRNNCPAIFSVGDEPKDRLPNEETVEFFDTNGYDIYSTNSVYGINTYFRKSEPYKPNTVMDEYSTFKKVINKNIPLEVPNYKHIGDKQFSLL